ncbi:MAG: biotin--[acetyl-CoA-carboxylase] ligase [Candidatus Delongbacteria bacterium]|nr:biotin--[acetyl-CoA-carboxylase] ligase [Candidatus Delongbacteria bacterium]MCG2760861.1 biotin--[acetyl-CoA-carboxylase] ligase [Candidatus Delongbacteria bacterium]
MKLENFQNIITLEKVDSTNTYLKRYSNSMPDGTVVFSREQTAGKGRLMRKWFGEKDKSVCASFLIKNIYDNVDAIRLSFLFSIAVKTVITKYIDYNKIALKWPNDVLASGKKICGILSEYSKDCVIVGVGLNVFDFLPPEEIDQPWTSIKSESDMPLDIEIIKKELLESVNSVFIRYCTNSLRDIPMIWFREADIKNISLTIKTNEDVFSGTVKSINNCGVLYVENKSTHEIKNISYGDVTYND